MSNETTTNETTTNETTTEGAALSDELSAAERAAICLKYGVKMPPAAFSGASPANKSQEQIEEDAIRRRYGICTS